LLAFLSNSTAPTKFCPLSLHDALPISALSPNLGVGFCGNCTKPTLSPTLGPGGGGGGARGTGSGSGRVGGWSVGAAASGWVSRADRKSTRLNSSHVSISYAVFCLKKKK